ncbi:NF-kappa-B-activating protein C-terminal domain containing protein, putative [Angomonas deanei]|uniref:NF-kappa-B-activating protein C-terminal domain containing protein, putative n=1 Tax=Angomonas deanei TaxID=59799 RepID=A0A7G2CD96_9TRYP|nr:NF-kappa-B-activating protein C-terminal domain containing protein, putative [Angomonas deanei]
MNTSSFWQTDRGITRDGEAFEHQLIQSLKKNPFSVVGHTLSLYDTLQGEPNSQKLNTVASKAEDIKAMVHSLVVSTGIPSQLRAEEEPVGEGQTPAQAAEDGVTDDVSLPNYQSPREETEMEPVAPEESAPAVPRPKAGGLAALVQEARTHEKQEEATNQKRPRVESDEDDEEDFAIILPSKKTADTSKPDPTATASSTKHPSQMSREEFLAQFKRAPRRGEIGRSADEIAAAESLGYVMSGSRSKAAQLYMDKMQRQLHEREASKLQQQFRKVEDEREDNELVKGLVNLIHEKIKK